MKFIPGEGREEGLGNPHAVSFKLWGRADGSCQCFLYMQILFFMAKMQAGDNQAGFASSPGGGMVLPGGVSAGEGQTWLLLASESRNVSRIEEVWPTLRLG